jgi:hypothetical protein
MSASEHLSPQQFVMMRPSELRPYAGRRDDKSSQAIIRHLAESITEHGYDPTKAQGNKAPITLGRSGMVEHLTEGNHRVHAMTRMGYDEPVPVRDER